MPPSLFSSLNLCKRLWPPSSPAMPDGCHPSSCAQGGKPGARTSLVWPEARVCVVGGGQGEVGSTAALCSLVRRVGSGLGKCHFGRFGDFVINKSFFIDGSRPSH